jgi:hypothetical protein
MLRIGTAIPAALLIAFHCRTTTPAPATDRDSASITAATATIAAEPAAVPAAAVEARVVATDERVAPGFRVRVGCSEDALNVPVAWLEWNDSSAGASPQRVDFTIYKDGFERNWYASIDMTRGGRAEMAPSLLRTEQRRETLRAFDVVVEPLPANQRRSDAKFGMQVRKLEPGLIYQWRMRTPTERGWIATHPTEVEIPVCVHDEEKH